MKKNIVFAFVYLVLAIATWIVFSVINAKMNGLTDSHVFSEVISIGDSILVIGGKLNKEDVKMVFGTTEFVLLAIEVLKMTIHLFKAATTEED